MQWALKSWRSRRSEKNDKESEMRGNGETGKEILRFSVSPILRFRYHLLPSAYCLSRRRPSRLPSGQLFFPDIRYPLFWFDSLRQILVVDRRKSSNKPVVRRPFWIFCRKGKAGFFS